MGDEEKLWMAERAKEELEMLELKYPNGFGHLKMELRSLISECDPIISSPLPVTSTRVSSTPNRCKRKSKEEESKPEKKKMMLKKDRVDMAIERAEACLKKIQLVKQSLFP